jgi:transcriptional regulator GlxA family with amidase domain
MPMAVRPGTTDLRQSLLRDALDVMEEDYAQPLEVDDVARRVLTSRRQLQRVFTEVHGSTFRSTLRSIRMRRAQELLCTRMPIGEVARAVGYTQPAQFAKAFRRTFGESPTEYRVRQAASGNDRSSFGAA